MRAHGNKSICAAALVLAACGEGFTTDDGAGASSASTSVSSTTDATTTATSATSGATSGAGGGAPIATPLFAEGDRLKANYGDLGDGAIWFISFFDTVLQESCSFTRFESGETVCAPEAGVVVSTYFTDEGCQEPLAMAGKALGCEEPRYARRTTAPASCETPGATGGPTNQSYGSIHAVTSKFEGPTIYKSSSGACTAMDSPEGLDLYTIGPAIPLSTYVAAQVVREPRGGPLSQDVLVGSDGSRRIAQAFSHESPCRPRSVAGTQVCVPIYGGAVNATLYFADQLCAKPYEPDFGVAATNLCSPPEYFLDRQVDENDCLVSEVFRRPGGDIDLPPLYLAFPSACSIAAFDGLVPSTLGVAFDPAELGVASSQTLGTGRVRGTFPGTGPDAPIGALTSFTDTARNETCTVITFDDGTSRCIGSSVLPSEYFTDAGCMIPAVVHVPDPCDIDDAPPTRGLVPSAQPACGQTRASGVARLHEVNAQVYVGSPGSCATVAVDPNATILVFDDPIDLGEYPIADIVMHSARREN